MGHIHAKEMALYAEDAKETDKPWERWEVKKLSGFGWDSLEKNPGWYDKLIYRRKNKTTSVTIELNEMEVNWVKDTYPHEVNCIFAKIDDYLYSIDPVYKTRRDEEDVRREMYRKRRESYHKPQENPVIDGVKQIYDDHYVAPPKRD